VRIDLARLGAIARFFPAFRPRVAIFSQDRVDLPKAKGK
jgi:hypothetical protein